MRRTEEALNFIREGLVTYDTVLTECKTIDGLENPEETAREIIEEIERLTSKMYVAFAQSGDFIDEVESIEEGKAYIEQLEAEDRENGNFEPDYYEIESEEHWTLWR